MMPRQRRGCRSGLLAGKATMTDLKGSVIRLSGATTGPHTLPRQAVVVGLRRNAGPAVF